MVPEIGSETSDIGLIFAWMITLEDFTAQRVFGALR
jgi:hypothetical protein